MFSTFDRLPQKASGLFLWARTMVLAILPNRALIIRIKDCALIEHDSTSATVV